MASERLLHLVKKLDHALHSNDKVRRARPLLDHVSSSLTLNHVWNLLEHFGAELAAFEILMSECDAEADNRGTRVVDILVKLLGPEPHACAAERVFRRQPRLRMGLLQVFE